jgi:transposase
LTRRPGYKELYNLVLQLAKEITFLKEELAQLKHSKNSRNSSIPPSKDENCLRANQSLRKSSGKKSGDQPGRDGKTLEMVTSPDVIISLEPDYYCNCGLSLDKQEAIKSQSRQILDICL